MTAIQSLHTVLMDGQPRTARQIADITGSDVHNVRTVLRRVEEYGLVISSPVTVPTGQSANAWRWVGCRRSGRA